MPADAPDAIRQMIQDRHDARQALTEAAKAAAIVVLPPAAWRDVSDRAASIGGRAELLAEGGELLVIVPLPQAEPTEPTDAAGATDGGGAMRRS